MDREQLQAIKAIKQKVEKEWLKIPGVVAVGIGKTARGKAGIIVSVREFSTEVQTMIPADINGIPVEIRISGPIQAL